MPTPTEIVQTAYAAFGRGDVPAMLALFSDDIDWQFTADRKAPYTGRMCGKAQMVEWFTAVAQNDDIHAFEPRQFLAGPDHVTVLGWERTTVRGKGTFESEWVHVWQLADGKITRFWGMLDSEAAATARG